MVHMTEEVGEQDSFRSILMPPRLFPGFFLPVDSSSRWILLPCGFLFHVDSSFRWIPLPWKQDVCSIYSFTSFQPQVQWKDDLSLSQYPN